MEYRNEAGMRLTIDLSEPVDAELPREIHWYSVRSWDPPDHDEKFSEEILQRLRLKIEQALKSIEGDDGNFRFIDKKEP